MARDFVVEASSGVIPDIGQITRADKLALERAVRAGIISKWRGHLYPETGSPYGIGPLKTCYGPKEQAAYFAAWRQS